MTAAVAIAIDLGSTRIKAAALGSDGALKGLISAPAPAIMGKGLVRESDASEYLKAAGGLLEETLAGMPADIPVGIASQRSSFLLWDRDTGKPETPLISWQDRRAEPWCRSNRDRGGAVVRVTGLPLSPHYAGPKLAHLFTQAPDLRRQAESGRLLFGTLETYCLWNWSKRREHMTDISIAARTMLADPRTSAWHDELLDLCRVPRPVLPAITPTCGKRIPLGKGGVVTATVSDQAAGVLGLLGPAPEAALINLGTGGFAVCPTGPEMKSLEGYPSGPLMEDVSGNRLFALEGTVNGIVTALSGLEGIEVPMPSTDPVSDIFCLPDTSGLGSPYWLAEMPAVISKPPSELSPAGLKQVILEGIVFRISRCLLDICDEHMPESLALAGGLAHDRFLGPALAGTLKRPLSLLAVKEATLLGAARLASGRSDWQATKADRLIPCTGEDCYLHEKLLQWQKWCDHVVRVFREGGTDSLLRQCSPLISGGSDLAGE